MPETVEQLKQHATVLQQSSPVLNEHIDSMNDDIARELRFFNPVLGIQYCVETLNLATQNNYLRGRAYALRNLGWCQLRTNLPREANSNLQSARKAFSELNDETELASVDNSLGLNQKILGNCEAALEHHLSSMRLYQKIGNKAGVASVLNNLGNIYFRLGDYSQSLDYNYQALLVSVESEAIRVQASILISLGNVLWRVDESAESIKILQQAFNLLQTHPDKQNEAGTLLNLGSSYESRGDQKQAMSHYKSGLRVAREIGSLEIEAEAQRCLGSLYSERGEINKAFVSLTTALEFSRKLGSSHYESETLIHLGSAYGRLGDIEQSSECLEKSLEISQIIGAKDLQHKAHLALSKIYEKQNNTTAALHHYQMFHQVWSDVYSVARARRIERLLFSHNLNKQSKSSLSERLQTKSRLNQTAFSPRKLQQINEFIAHHLEENISGADLAAVAGFNHDHFIRSFKQSVGTTPHQYVLARRVATAKQLIETTNLPFSEIALRCGFSDQSHLTVQFRLSTGVTPKQFRDSL